MKRFASIIIAIAAILCSAAALAGEKPSVSLQEINEKGYIPRWLVIGKFSPGIPGGFTGMVMSRNATLTDADYFPDNGGEVGIEPEAGMEIKRGESTVTWAKFDATSQVLDLGDAMGKSTECVMYAAAYITSDAPASLFIETQSLAGVAAFANHKLVYRSPSGALGAIGKDKFQVQLNSGINLVIIKFGGLRFERAAAMLKMPMSEIRGFIRDFMPALSEGSGLAMTLAASPLERVGASSVYVQTNLTPSGFFRGKANKPAVEFAYTITNSSDQPIDNVEIKIRSSKLDSDASESTGIDPNGNKTLFISLPVKPGAAGQTFSAEITAVAAGETLKLPTSITVPKNMPVSDQVIYYVPGFHADPVWIEDQRDYSVALIGSSRQNMLLLDGDPYYGVYMSELDYLKPFYDMYPEWRGSLRAYIKEGRIGTGGSYNQPVEKLISGEALVRNILYGKMFHEKVLGDDPKVYMGWDIFGHVPQLSQIVAKTGGEGAMWSKGIWGFPPIFQHTALDGTRLLHKRGEYGSWSSGLDTLRPAIYNKFQEFKTYGLDYDIRLDCSDFKPPTPWIPGNTKMLRDLLPSIEVGGQGGNRFFENVKREMASGQADIPVTSRDMGYYHQGTALTRESLKTGNRVAENSVITAEKFATIASLLGAKYPDIALDKAWRQLLFGQHHDALTGTINDKSYLDLMQGYRESLELSSGVIDKSLAHIGREINTEPAVSVLKGSIPISVFNPLNWDRTDVVKADIDFSAAPPKGFTITDFMGTPVPFELQQADRGDDGAINSAKVVFIAEKIPQMGYSLYFAQPADAIPPAAIPNKTDAAEIENDFYKMKVDPSKGGGIVSLLDKTAGKEIINPANGVGNDIAAISEDPGRHEPPWEMFSTNVRSFSSDAPAKVSAETGPVSSRLRIEGAAGKTGTVREIVIYKNMRRIDFVTNIVDYKGINEMFVVTFPVAVENAVPVFEDRYGAIVRKKSQGKLNFQTWQMNNYSNHFAHAAFQWLDQSQSGLVEFTDNDGKRSADFALGMMAIVTDHNPAVRKAATTLLDSFIKKGITSTPWYDDGDKARLDSIPHSDSTMPADMNFDLAFGTSFRVSLNSGRDNIFTIRVFSMLDNAVVAKFNGEVSANGYASMLVYDPTSSKDWPQVPLLIVKALNDEQLQKAVDALAADFDADAVITLPASANATGDDQQVENYGVAVLNRGNVLNSIENDGTMTVALMHTASFFPRLPFTIVPENRTTAFPYALYPHAGNWRDAGLYRVGFEYNNPLIAKQLDNHPGPLPAGGTSFLTVQPDTVVVTALKPRGNPTASLSYAPNNPKDAVTLRLYEATGFNAAAKITFFTGIRKAISTNLLEEGDTEKVPVTAGVLEDTVTPFSIRTYALLPQNIPPLQFTGTLGPETEPYQLVYSRYWMHNHGAAPLGDMPVSIGIRGDIKTKLQISQGGITINDFEVFVTNDYTDRKVTGKVRIEVPFDWKVLPDSFDYELKPGEQFTKRIVLAFLGEGRDGIIKASTEQNGQKFQDVLEVGDHKLDVTAKRDGDKYTVSVKNPNNQSIEGELYLITPQETWGAALTGEFALENVTPRVQGFSIPARGGQDFTFTVTDKRGGMTLTEWAVVKCAYNGRLIYVRAE